MSFDLLGVATDLAIPDTRMMDFRFVETRVAMQLTCDIFKWHGKLITSLWLQVYAKTLDDPIVQIALAAATDHGPMDWPMCDRYTGTIVNTDAQNVLHCDISFDSV